MNLLFFILNIKIENNWTVGKIPIFYCACAVSCTFLVYKNFHLYSKILNFCFYFFCAMVSMKKIFVIFLSSKVLKLIFKLLAQKFFLCKFKMTEIDGKIGFPNCPKKYSNFFFVYLTKRNKMCQFLLKKNFFQNEDFF